LARTSRNISLSSDLERFILRLVRSGRYGSASEVVRAALRLLERYEATQDGVRTDGYTKRPAGK
jgi:antitoxin ParD1/3/4